ncbi:hypothetical protein [Synechococcus sp. BMK-MC-1]|nr:hypothetical protein [Synechococcus sp. BMK-MC-1]QNI66434.1 hypothetical protein SynBMKMC1_00322 [Synechococcus sp. BMK-MC-1]
MPGNYCAENTKHEKMQKAVKKEINQAKSVLTAKHHQAAANKIAKS